MTTPIAKSKSEIPEACRFGPTVPFDSIREPGAYVCCWSGHLLRVAGGSLSPAAMPRISFLGDVPLMVTKIADDPSVSLTAARLRAANANVPVNF